ncbi:MAG: hypothetical protein Q8933_08180 [Bacteroidota bacterium]|nr:hypothetical protein [Bacteroidota bacterium]MDP4190988.1 hypothetical protein [Bacteroidota bacterium]MDP4195127.1 hypothetical protein [Bacteroidota bacterium]
MSIIYKSILGGALMVCFFLQGIIFAQNDQYKSPSGKNSAAFESLSRELSDNLKLSQFQENKLSGILEDFQSELSGIGKIRSGKENNETFSMDSSSVTTRNDKTAVKDRDEVKQDKDNSQVNSGRAKTKSENDDNNMTGSRGNPMAVNFERARIDADSRIEDMLTPEQAIKYGKIKSDWWDKVREKVHQFR